MTEVRRVAIFMYDFELSGVVVNAVRLANALAARGHDVRLLVCRREGQCRHTIDPRVRVEVVAGRPKGSRAIDLLLRVGAIRSAVRRLHPEIILSAGNHGHLPLMLASIGLRGTERVLRISNQPAHPGEGIAKRRLRRLVVAAQVRLADRLLLVSPRLVCDPTFAKAARAGRTAVVPNGVDVAAIRQLAGSHHDRRRSGTEMTLVAVGRLAPQKNLTTLVRALASINDVRPARLSLVGRGSTDAKKGLIGLARQLGVDDRIDFVGEQANPFPYMRDADVFILPSLWEGRSNVLLEAMACGVPIVAARTAGDAQDLLGYGRYGLLVDPMDDAGLAEAILIQAGPDQLLPGDRVEQFDGEQALDHACRALLAHPSDARSARRDYRAA